MTKPRLWLTVVVVLLLVNITTLAFLWMQNKSGRHRRPGMTAKDFIVKEAGLSATQQEQYDSLRKIHHEAMIRLDETNRQLHDRMFDKMAANIADSLMIDSTAEQISRIEMEKQKITFYHFRELRRLLDKGQQQKFDRILKDALRLLNKPSSPQEQGPPPEGPPPGRP